MKMMAIFVSSDGKVRTVPHHFIRVHIITSMVYVIMMLTVIHFTDTQLVPMQLSMGCTTMQYGQASCYCTCHS